MDETPPTRLLLVCMGNICRSPLAEGIVRARLAEAGLAERVEVDSAGTERYHVGQPPDPRACQIAERFGVDVSGLRARQVGAEDFRRFDVVLAADRHNLRLLERLRPAGAQAELALLLDWCGLGGEVPDPYYGGAADFQQVYALLDRAARGLVERLRRSPEP